ncbi:MAG: phosphopantothenoylcysteine decarboxylase [Lentisphaerae bacterium]|nr:phosphopantothenoylcysteine decarboxylase [Lentisphaerota bacterium]
MKILVTAGPTREAIDPVRFLSNRSSGRMGYAIATVARDAGHIVRLISGPVALSTPTGVERIDVISAHELAAAVLAALPWCDALIMAAAVADWRPVTTSDVKLKKQAGPLTLELERTEDVLGLVQPLKGNRIVVGFAAETGDPVPEATRKLSAKGLDMIVANDISQPNAGFEVETNAVTLIEADGTTRQIDTAPKAKIAAAIVAWVERHARRDV